MKPELLAPAGDLISVYAAINAGADAVYAGSERFSARAYAGNLSRDEYIRAIKCAHLHNVKIYLTLNTLLKVDELKDAYESVRPLYESGLDGVIVQDLGAAHMLSYCFPGLKLHASTQMSIMNSYGADLMRANGFDRIVPARELTLDEVRDIRQKTGMEIECFIHGAMCYSYSGLCLMSSIIGERSGNRGRCAGTCRLPFCAHGSVNAGRSEYPLSMKDMCTVDIIPELIDAGIDSFKIEGRMKSPEYVAGVTAMYRKYIDRYLETGDTKMPIDDNDKKRLHSLYIRTGVSAGYYEGYKGKNLITLKSPGYNGNDLEYEKELTFKYVHECDRLDISLYAYLHEGEKAKLKAVYGDISVNVTGAEVDSAKTAPIKEDTVKDKLAKTGDTPFAATYIETDIGANAFIPVGALNELRREALIRLEEAILEHMAGSVRVAHVGERALTWTEYKDMLYGMVSCVDATSTGVCDILVHTADQLEAALDIYDELADAANKSASRIRVGRIILDYALVIGKESSSISRLFETDIHIFVSMPAVMRPRIIRGNDKENTDASKLYDRIYEAIKNSPNIRGALVHSLDEIAAVRERLPGLMIITDTQVYVHNPAAYAFLVKENVSGITYPYELNKQDLIRLSNEIWDDRGVEKSLVIYGYIPMMVSVGCIKKTYGACDHISEYSKHILLNDRKGVDFIVANDCNICANIIYNERPLSLYGMIDECRQIGADRLRICLTVEDREESDMILRGFFRPDQAVCKRLKELKTTTGHMKRGAL